MSEELDRFDAFAGARKAASLIVLRDRAPAGLEVLMLRRAERDGDLRSGAAVFPGGVLDARDRQAHAHCRGWNDAQASARLGLPEGGLDYLVAAVRESFEEVGLLFAADDGGERGEGAQTLDLTALEHAHQHWRGPLQRGEQPLHALCEALQLTIDLSGWHYWSHWLTPPGNPKRFDTRFFVTRAPAGQLAEADGGEAVELMWLTPQQALEPARGLKLLPVTRRTLQQLARHADVAQALAFAQAQQAVPLTMPRLATRRGERTVVLPDELPWAEVARLDPAGRGDVLAEIVPGQPVRLSPRVIRVTAANAGVMTGPGTNSYLVADPAVNRWTVIDPGPADETHLQALLAAAPGPIERILVTHTHIDHSPGARALAAASGAPVLGRRPAHALGQDPDFSPTQELQGGEQLTLGPDATLAVVHTPGHASNHLCYQLLQERLLFTGDHVMQGSTVVINPPDGDMAAYFASLGALLAVDLRWLAPGHGFLVAQPHAVLRALIAHRTRREDKVLATLKAQAGARLDELLPRVYDDTPQQLHPVARRSLLAHLQKLRGEGRAQEQGGVWSAAAR
ncbi:MAG: MBL fold metallo-hydrolase [Rubrivivax sp.]|nr:MBL fold metallo-hydrolase [Rubrivivax sp.]